MARFQAVDETLGSLFFWEGDGGGDGSDGIVAWLVGLLLRIVVRIAITYVLFVCAAMVRFMWRVLALCLWEYDAMVLTRVGVWLLACAAVLALLATVVGAIAFVIDLALRVAAGRPPRTTSTHHPTAGPAPIDDVAAASEEAVGGWARSLRGADLSNLGADDPGTTSGLRRRGGYGTESGWGEEPMTA